MLLSLVSWVSEPNLRHLHQLVPTAACRVGAGREATGGVRRGVSGGQHESLLRRVGPPAEPDRVHVPAGDSRELRRSAAAAPRRLPPGSQGQHVLPGEVQAERSVERAASGGQYREATHHLLRSVAPPSSS